MVLYLSKAANVFIYFFKLSFGKMYQCRLLDVNLTLNRAIFSVQLFSYLTIANGVIFHTKDDNRVNLC